MTQTLVAILPCLIKTHFEEFESLENSSGSSRDQIFKDILGKFSYFIVKLNSLDLPHDINFCR